MVDFIPKIKIKGEKNITINLNDIDPNTKIKTTGGENITISLNNAKPDTEIVVRDAKSDVNININNDSNNIGEILSGTEDKISIGDSFKKEDNVEGNPP